MGWGRRNALDLLLIGKEEGREGESVRQEQ